MAQVFKRCDTCNGTNFQTVTVDILMFGIGTTHEICETCVDRVSVGQLYRKELAFAEVAHG